MYMYVHVHAHMSMQRGGTGGSDGRFVVISAVCAVRAAIMADFRRSVESTSYVMRNGVEHVERRTAPFDAIVNKRTRVSMWHFESLGGLGRGTRSQLSIQAR